MEPHARPIDQPGAGIPSTPDAERHLAEFNRAAAGARAAIARVRRSLVAARTRPGARHPLARQPSSPQAPEPSAAQPPAAKASGAGERRPGLQPEGQGTDRLAALHAETLAALARIQAKNPGLKSEMEKAHAYALLPIVARAGLLLGGARGYGEVYEQGRRIGFTRLTQLTFGIQVGGQTMTELILFASKDSLEAFRRAPLVFNGNLSAVLVRGASHTANFRDVKAYAFSRGGMLLEASLGGQRFRFLDMDAASSFAKSSRAWRRGRAQRHAPETAPDQRAESRAPESENPVT